jgi:hypothetical protein
LVNQLVQVFVVSSRTFIYKFVSGVAVILTMGVAPDLTIGVKATLSAFLIQWGRTNDQIYFGIDLVALILALLIVEELRRPRPSKPAL